jgi:predicted transcriptional regulator with HTH domain
MQKISNAIELKMAISELKIVQANQLIELKAEILTMYYELTPFNIFKSSLSRVASIPDWRKKIVDTLLGLSVGYFSKKILIGNSHNPIKNVAGALMQLGVTNMVSNNSEPLILLINKGILWLKSKSDSKTVAMEN